MRLTRFRLIRQDLRLGSGLILFIYVAAHFANHALGLISIAAAERGLQVAVIVWHSLPGTMMLYGATGVHIALAFVALYEHRTLRMPPMELLRIALGLGIPPLLIAHAVTTRLAFEAYGTQPDYAHVVWMLWHSSREGRQMVLLVPGWLHGCLGFYFAFGRRIWFQRLRLVLFGAALLLPTLATLGFLEMLKEVSVLAQDPTWFNANVSSLDATQMDKLAWASDGLLALYVASIGAVLVARIVRWLIERSRETVVSITYPGGTIAAVPRGWSILEASRSLRIPRLSMCGGRARCPTCRVHVVAGGVHCPPPAPNELETLERIHAPEGTRLACQLRPQGDVTVVPLVAATPSPPRKSTNTTVEREIALLLVGILWPAPHARLPLQERLYLLSRFSETVGETMRTAGGVPTQFLGGGVMALFGLEVGPKEANRQTLSAGAQVDRRLLALRDRLAQDLDWTADFVIYLHTGSAGVGETGDYAMRTLTAVGNTIDVARQLAAQHHGGKIARAVLSKAVMIAAGLDTRSANWREIALPNDARLHVTSIDGTTALLGSKAVAAG